MKMMDWKVVVASPSRSIRAALINILDVRLGITAITETDSSADALKAVHCDRPDIILYDTEMDDLPLTHFIAESGVAKRGSSALILMASSGGAPTDSSNGYTPVRRLPRPFSADVLISLLRDLYDPLEYRRTVRVHPPDGVTVEIKSGSTTLKGDIFDISLGGLSCSMAVNSRLNIYSTATLTIVWSEAVTEAQGRGRFTLEGEAIRFEALPSSGSEERQCLVAFRFIERRGDDKGLLTERVNNLIDATSREVG